MTNLRYLLALLLSAAAAPASAGVTGLTASLDEIVDRHSIGMESAFLGEPLPGNRYGNSIAIQPGIGFYGNESILGALSGTWHTSKIVPWDVGLCVGALDLDVSSWTVAVSTGRPVWSNDFSEIAVEGVAGYQFMDGRSRDTAIRLDPPDPFGGGYRSDTLFDSFRLGHLMIHAVYAIDLWLLRPVVDIGWVGTAYRFQGNEWDGSFPLIRGDERTESGFNGKTTWGLGAALDIDHAILFGGFKVGREAAVFQTSVGVEF